MFPNQQLGVLAYSTSFAANADAGRRFMVAYIKGVRDYNDGVFKKVPAAHELVVNVFMKYTTLKDPVLIDQIKHAGLNPDGAVNVDSMNAFQDHYIPLGVQKQRIALDQLVDSSFARAAVAQLGPYK
jgi:NitT/TauT family transport system substrate-binding protein